MFDTRLQAKSVINIDEYRDKVLGCWTGKNIGGTLGAPFEGRREMNDAKFYTQDLKGSPAPNDDLDLQLAWLLAVEENGVYRITPRLLGEYWLSSVVGPWNEYGVCKANIQNGLYPPLSGSCNNDTWKWSNGAWIRSEIWACLFPGSPDEAAALAYADSCCDHSGEGVYAEVFTAVIESAAFIVSDVRKLVEIGLAKIPADCRIARSVKLACKLYDKGTPFKKAREAIVKDNEDLGWFQAPGNIGFAMLGLLYGEGDFGKSVCLATNCGDDTDCTAATVGALLGIIKGRSGLPKKWIEPIGESIKTVAIDTYDMNVPANLGELTDRVVSQALLAWQENPAIMRIADEKTCVDKAVFEKLLKSDAVKCRVWDKSPYALAFSLPYAELFIDYEDGPFVAEGETKTLDICIANAIFVEKVAQLKLQLPEGWSSPTGGACALNSMRGMKNSVKLQVTPGPLTGVMTYVPLEIRLAGRFNPVTVNVPFQAKGAATMWKKGAAPAQEWWDMRNRRFSRFTVK